MQILNQFLLNVNVYEKTHASHRLLTTTYMSWHHILYNTSSVPKYLTSLTFLKMFDHFRLIQKLL